MNAMGRGHEELRLSPSDSRAVPDAEQTAFREVSMVIDVDWEQVLERFLTIVSRPTLPRRPQYSRSVPPR